MRFMSLFYLKNAPGGRALCIINTDRQGQAAFTQFRWPLEEQSDQGLHFLPMSVLLVKKLN